MASFESYQSWQADELCSTLQRLWWRLPLSYKRALHSVFAAPLGVCATPLCYVLQLHIARYAHTLHTCVVYELGRAPRMALSEGAAYVCLAAQWERCAGASRALIFGLTLRPDQWNVADPKGSALPALAYFSSIFCDWLALYCSDSAPSSAARK